MDNSPYQISISDKNGKTVSVLFDRDMFIGVALQALLKELDDNSK